MKGKKSRSFVSSSKDKACNLSEPVPRLGFCISQCKSCAETYFSLSVV